MTQNLVGTEVLQVQGIAANGQLSAQTFQTTTGNIAALGGSNPNAPIPVGVSATAIIGRSYLLNTAAGSVLTLPAPSGKGGVIKVFVTTTTTSGAHKVLANSTSDFLNGILMGNDAGVASAFSAAAATDHALQMPFAGSQPSGGFIGDWFEFTDVAAHLWEVKGAFQSGTTSTSPFSATNT